MDMQGLSMICADLIIEDEDQNGNPIHLKGKLFVGRAWEMVHGLGSIINTWEEAQDLLCPPPSVKPSIVVIEDLEFEEYDEGAELIDSVQLKVINLLA